MIGSPSGGAGATVVRNLPRLDQVLRAAFALLAGVLIYTALAAAFRSIAGIEAPPGPGGKKPVQLLLCLVAAMLLAGYLTARISGRWQLTLSAGLGALMALGAGPADMQWQGIESPFSQLVSLLLLPPSAAIGGWVAGWVAWRQATKRAAAPLQLPIEIRQGAIFTWFGFFLSLGMMAVALWAVRQEGAPPSLWFGIFFFGGASLLLGWRALHPKPQAILSEEGLEITAWRVVIPWSEIEDAVPSWKHPIEYVYFKVCDAERYLERLTPLQRAVTQTGETEPNIGIVLTGTPYRAEEICALVWERIDSMDGFARATSPLPLS